MELDLQVNCYEGCGLVFKWVVCIGPLCCNLCWMRESPNVLIFIKTEKTLLSYALQLVFSCLSHSWELKKCELRGHSLNILSDCNNQFFFGLFRAAVHNWMAVSHENKESSEELYWLEFLYFSTSLTIKCPKTISW